MQYSSRLLRHFRLTIGQNIHRLRSEKRWSLHRLSILTDIPEHLLDHYEVGKNEIALDELLRIACALKAEVPEFL